MGEFFSRWSQPTASFFAAELELLEMSWPTRSRVSSVTGAVVGLATGSQYWPLRSSMVWGSAWAKVSDPARSATVRSILLMGGIVVGGDFLSRAGENGGGGGANYADADG